MVERRRSGVSLPQGTVTFLFTDIEGSTRLLEERGDEYAEMLAGHRHALRGEFARHGGVEVDTANASKSAWVKTDRKHPLVPRSMSGLATSSGDALPLSASSGA
jgi:class 3 adenylate cyclase